MNFLWTGQPGNGKTLNALVYVEARRQKDGRAVYYHGVKGLTLPWLAVPLTVSGFTAKEIEKGFPAQVPDWDAIPDGAMIFLDECHKFFPPRSSTGIARPYVQFLAEHRHRGFDIFLITQGVKDIDGFLRSRVGKHFHVDRRFGVEATRLWQWERCADPTSSKDKKEGQSSRWVFPKEAYGWYTSSVEHTHKHDLPWRKLGVIAGCAIALPLLVWFAIHSFTAASRREQAKSAGGEGSAVQLSNVPRPVIDFGSSYWGSARVERVSGVPESAGMYDGLQKVLSQPRIEGCLEIVRGGVVTCRCSGPNSAELDIPTAQCMAFVKRGWFDETRKYSDVKAANVAQLNASRSAGAVGDVVGAPAEQSVAKP
jgi:zona occludens toxin